METEEFSVEKKSPVVSEQSLSGNMFKSAWQAPLERPRIGFICLAKRNHYKGEIQALLDSWKLKLANETWLDAIVEETLVFDDAMAADAVRKMHGNGVDLTVVVVGTWIYSSLAITLINDLNMPVVLWGLSDRIANGNLGASIQIRYVLQEMKRQVKYISGKINDEKNWNTICTYLRAAWTKRRMHNRKIASIGGKCMMMYQTQVNEYDWKRAFGVDFPQYDMVQVFAEMDSIPDAEVKAAADAFLKKVDKVNWQAENDTLAEDTFEKQARLYLAFKKFRDIYNLDIFAVKCMPELMHEKFGFGYGGCIALAMLNDDGIISACEADVPAGLSMFIMRQLSGKPSVFADIARANKPARSLTFFNCGTAPISQADRTKGVQIWPVAGNIADEAVAERYFIGRMKGGCIGMELKNDEPVTMLRIGGNGDTLRFHVARATTCQREIEGAEDVGNRWPGFGLRFKQELDDILINTVGHHYSISYGDYVDDLKALAEILNIKFVYNE